MSDPEITEHEQTAREVLIACQLPRGLTDPEYVTIAKKDVAWAVDRQLAALHAAGWRIVRAEIDSAVQREARRVLEKMFTDSATDPELSLHPGMILQYLEWGGIRLHAAPERAGGE